MERGGEKYLAQSKNRKWTQSNCHKLENKVCLDLFLRYFSLQRNYQASIPTLSLKSRLSNFVKNQPKIDLILPNKSKHPKSKRSALSLFQNLYSVFLIKFFNFQNINHCNTILKNSAYVLKGCVIWIHYFPWKIDLQSGKTV